MLLKAGTSVPPPAFANGQQGLSPTRAAIDEIPATYLAIYRTVGEKIDLDWRFLAAIGSVESDHGRNPYTNVVNPSGCVGPMQIGTGGDCGDFLGAWGVDGDEDGKIDPRNPADAVATAARGLRVGKGAPGAGGSVIQYYRAACAYYGACSDGRVDYADDVLRIAVRYGFPGR